MSYRLDENTKERLRNVFLTMHEDEEGRRALANLLFDRFFVPDDRAYDPVREMIRKMRPGR
ncbi:PhnD/SsuA/transferrin family substrate-binding protein [Moorella sulfitireducens]|uniref:PhnD/SsuA/transferrin family substrate-binding protein n=1 Tax=Neomoorella sulfitireducens TaxID=2972948 RepID=UPI003BF55D76